MAAKKIVPPSIPRSGNTDELDRLEKELTEAKEYGDRLVKDLDHARSALQNQKKEIDELRKSLEIAFDKLKVLEAVKEISGSGDAAKTGYVEIATLPIGPNKNVYPLPTHVDGIKVPRKIDDDGVMYESVPVKTAIALMVPGNGNYERYLVGPCDKIEGDAAIMQATDTLKGVYSKHFVHEKHKKTIDVFGKVNFIRVTVEESIQKVD